MTDASRYSAIESQLKDHLQNQYRQVIDADQRLDAIVQEGHGKFTAITEDPVFNTRARRFRPYWNEIAEQVAALDFSESEDTLQPKLARIVNQLALLSQLVTAFKEKTKG